jgi:hypothetical protein
MLVTQGTIAPKPKRNTSSRCIATRPLSPTTRRTKVGFSWRRGMKSTSVTAPSSVSKRVSRIRVLGRYRRVMVAVPPRGAISQRPFSGVPSKAAKQASESNRGQHSQSTDPSFATSAADPQSPMSA